ncbi:aminopeptidase N-like [Wyeomyia smithii]|uniref:aminopeptidase N-like n=1 Tax=Wyeomyia smithii TaxID=174621 RepID=UPI0024680A09|nr:aminopeptidase N-like [Wyeomyia smithii]
MIVILSVILLVLSPLAVTGQRWRVDRQNLAMDTIHPQAQIDKRDFDSFRLPNTSVPTHYNLFLDTNIHLADFTFNGSVQIQLTILENTKQIVLHKSRNQILRVQLITTNQLHVALDGVEYDLEKEFMVINTKTTLLQGSNYRLDIEFSGELRNDMLGFYRSSYVDAEGMVKYLAVTQFEASYARSAFPCFDEPAIRATFSISISCGWDYKATSNMPVLGITIQPNEKKLTRFQVTPRMPTYLVAFMVTDFTSKRITLQEPTRLTMEIFARPTASDQLELGLETGVKAIRALETYCNRTYDLPKLDQVAVPDFYFGAMENWGLVKYAEQYLLFDPEKASNVDKENLITIITHEFVHQFFGNLVTPKWWTDIFLSEGFATMYEYYIGAEVEPTIRFKELFPVEALQTAFYVDSFPSTRPLSYYVESNAMSQFDIIAYQKGGSVFRMMNYALGQQTFQKGIQKYLEVNKDSAVDPLDLFDGLQFAAETDAVLPVGVTVAAALSSWVYQSGYPVVTVKYSAISNEITFEQQHFSSEPDAQRTWWIPISFDLSSQPDRDETQTIFWISQDSKQFILRLSIPDDVYLLVNPHQTGYYRVNYDSGLWQRLINQLRNDYTVIPPVSRAQLIDDSIKLVQAGELDMETSFELFQYLAEEVDYIPWYTAFASDNLQYINNGLVVDAEAYKAFQSFLSYLAEKVFRWVGFAENQDEPHEYQRLRAMALEWYCRMGSAICRAGARQLMQQDLDNTRPLASYIKHSIYCGGLMEASQEEFAAVFDAYRASGDATERSVYLSALGCNENEELLTNYLSTTLLGPDEIGDWVTIFRSVYSRNNFGYETFSKWLNVNSVAVLEIYGGESGFVAILADIQSRLGSIDNFATLIGLLKEFQPTV